MYNTDGAKMYSVFLVDDEHIVLEGIRNKIDWENSEFSFAGEAGDGELALSMIQEVKPDILITDIKMPFMDGLELSRMVKKIQPWIRIIILSGHDEFDYAKEAISIGVEDYILKPFTHEELLASLNKVSESLSRERKQFSDISRMKEELESSAILVRNNFLTELVLGNQDSAAIMKKAEELKLNLLARFYKVIVSDLHCENHSEDTNENVKLQEIQKAGTRILHLEKKRSGLISFFIGPNRIVSIITENNSEEIEEAGYNIAEAIGHMTEQDSKCTVISSIGKTVEHVSEISSSYDEAAHVLDMARFWNKSRIVSADDVNRTNGGSLSLYENDPIVERLKYAGKNEIDAIIQQYLDLLKNNSDHFSVIASYLLVDVIMAVSKLIEDLGGNVKNVMPEILAHSFVDNAVQDEEVFIKEIRIVLEKLLSYRDSRIQGRYGDTILKAKEYIQENYASQDTSLRSVAEAVHLSPNHFSTIFSQECGTTFIEYLTNVRIEAAKKMLKETDMKGSDIAYECGFGDPHYFSFIFKKNTGMSPREYKGK